MLVLDIVSLKDNYNNNNNGFKTGQLSHQQLVATKVVLY